MLVADLSSDRAVVREAAVARLTVIGARAAGALAALVADAHAPAAARPRRCACFEATAASKRPGIGPPCPRRRQRRDRQGRHRGAGSARAKRGGAAVVDRLTAIALDRKRAIPIREAAVRALLDLDKSSLRPLLKSAARRIRRLTSRRWRTIAHPPPEEPWHELAGAGRRRAAAAAGESRFAAPWRSRRDADAAGLLFS